MMSTEIENLKYQQYKRNILGATMMIGGALAISTALFMNMAMSNPLTLSIFMLVGIISCIGGLILPDILIKGFSLTVGSLILIFSFNLIRFVDRSQAGLTFVERVPTLILLVGILFLFFGYKKE